MRDRLRISPLQRAPKGSLKLVVKRFTNVFLQFLAQKGNKRPACIPYVSEYSDCSEYTDCKGCTQCRCDRDGQWQCFKKRITCSDLGDEMEFYEDGTDDNTVGKILQELAIKEKEKRIIKTPNHRAPLPEKRKRTTESTPLGRADEEVMKELHELLRGRRSLADSNETHNPIKFHHTIDEINEDTLKNSNISGTLAVQKVDAIHSAAGSRRAGLLVNSTTNPLQIEYNHPPMYNNHITDDKIEPSLNNDKYDAFINEKLHNIMNYTQNAKNKELSKVVVNELKKGSEMIGDPNAPVTSNITFTPEKDTLTAMAFIAGNLLNKLWNLERDNSDDSIETDKQKSQKISDLLDLFKEPLSYRQELFLKDALEQLSDVVNKDKTDARSTICKTVDEIKKSVINVDKKKEGKKDENKQDAKDENAAAANALSKLNDVLDLIKKYEALQINLHDIKHPVKLNVQNGEIPALRITKDEKSSLSLFGNILEKITNLLIPNKHAKVKSKIRNQNILKNSYNLEDEVKKAFNINLDGAKISSKDKLVLDYINRIQKNPCPLSDLQEDMSIKYKQSDILLNLSEFFKIKSYSDLLKLVESSTESVSTSTPATTTKLPELTTSYNILKMLNSNSSTEIENNTSSINDNLKIHLKAVLNDLIRLQSGKGKNLKTEQIDIADVLPCLLNMLKIEKGPQKGSTNYSVGTYLNKIKRVLQAVKKDTKNVPQNRRSNVDGDRKPKSAVVWERVIKNLNQDSKPSRRSLNNDEPESYDAVKKMIDHMETNSTNTYKMTAIYKDVPASQKLVLLKTLLLDTSNNANILEKMSRLNKGRKLPENELADLIDFVDNTATNLNLNEKILQTIDKSKQQRFNVLSSINKQPMRGSETSYINSNKIKTTKQKALNQLIKNRVNEYLKVKESESATQDVVYDIGQRILSHLERGNDQLAQELYKILMEKDLRKDSNSGYNSKIYLRTQPEEKRSFIRTGDATNKQWVSEDLFLRTLESALENIKTI